METWMIITIIAVGWLLIGFFVAGYASAYDKKTGKGHWTGNEYILCDILGMFALVAFIGELLAERRCSRKKVDEGALNDKKLSETVTKFTGEMRIRLREKERQGYFGWDGNSPTCQDLFYSIKDDTDKLNYIFSNEGAKRLFIDIANRAMFLWYRTNNKTNNYERTQRSARA